MVVICMYRIFIILLLLILNCFILRPKDDHFTCIMLKTIPNLSRQYFYTGFSLPESFASFVWYADYFHLIIFF